MPSYDLLLCFQDALGNRGALAAERETLSENGRAVAGQYGSPPEPDQPALGSRLWEKDAALWFQRWRNLLHGLCRAHGDSGRRRNGWSPTISSGKTLASADVNCLVEEECRKSRYKFFRSLFCHAACAAKRLRTNSAAASSARKSTCPGFEDDEGHSSKAGSLRQASHR